MQNLTFGITSILICSILYYFSWKKHLISENKLALFLLSFAGVILRFYVATDFYLHEWDERYHALVAKNLIQHPFLPTLYDDAVFSFDYKSWSNNHIWLHKQPLSLWFIAISLKVFGINEIAVRLPSILFSSAAIFLTYQIADFLFKNKRVAIFAAFFHSIHGLSIEMASGRIATDHVDTLFQFLIELGVYFAILSVGRKNRLFSILTGIVVGLAILTKWLPAGIVVLLWFLLQLGYQKTNIKKGAINLFLLASAIILTFLPWQIYILDFFPLEAKWEYTFNAKHIFEALDEQGKPFFYHFNMLRINYGELVYLPLLWFLYYILKLKDRKSITNALLLIVWIIIPYLFFSIAKTKMQGYTLFTAPAVFIISSFFIVEFGKSNQKKYLKNIIIALLFLLAIRYSIERIKPFQKIDRNPEWVTKIKELSKTLEAKKGQKIILLNVDRPIEMMFYCPRGVIAYDYIPEKEELNKAHEKKYTAYLLEDKAIGFELKLMQEEE